MQVVATAQTGGGGSARGLLGKERAPLRALSRRGALHGAPPVRQQLQDPGSQQIVVLGARHSEKPAGGDLLALSGSSKCAQAFLKHFDKATEEELITHYFSHPHCPKENSHVERKIQTTKYELWAFKEAYTAADLNKLVDEWNYTYNHVRPHQSLDYLTPVEFLSRWNEGSKDREQVSTM